MKIPGQNENPRSRLTSLSSGSEPPFFVSDTDLPWMQPTAQIHSTNPRKFKPAYHTQTRDVPRWRCLILIAIEIRDQRKLSFCMTEWSRLQPKLSLSRKQREVYRQLTHRNTECVRSGKSKINQGPLKLLKNTEKKMRILKEIGGNERRIQGPSVNVGSLAQGLYLEYICLT